MKGKDIIKIIQDNKLEEFELKVNELKCAGTIDDWGVYLNTWFIDELVDIGYSDKTVTFGIIEN